MKAIRVHQPGGPDVMAYEDVAEPVPGQGEVAVRIQAAGLNPVDTYIRAGSYADLAYPYTPGMDGGGVVESVGEGVTNVAPGDRVYCGGSISGTCAELALCRASRVHRLPDALSFEQGASIGVPYVTAYCALFQRAGARLGETVLVHGASGGVGTAALQLAHSAGLRVIGTAGSQRGRQLVKELGADNVLDHTREGYLDELMKLTGGRGVDIILEMLANVNLGRDLGVLAAGGRVVVIGSRGEVTINPREIMRRDAAVLGLLLLNATDAFLTDIHSRMHTGFESGALAPVVGQSFPLREAARAHEQIMAPGAYGNIVLIP